jgi:hypothetical protein
MSPGRGSALAAVVVGVAAAAVLAPRADAPRPVGPADRSAGTGSSGEVVTRTVLTCPESDPVRGAVPVVRVGLAPTDERVARAGSVRRGPVGDVARPVDVARGAIVDVPPDGGPTVVATGGPAAGLFGFRTARRAASTLAVSPCVAPRAEWWFTGAGGGLDHSSTLLLTNVDPGPAVVDLRVLGPDGEVETVGTSGITLPPESRKRIDLTDIAPQTDELALEVHADRGRVAASVLDSLSTGPSALPGQEWLPGADRASRTVLLAGLPARAANRTLLVGNPSDREAVVEVRVSGRSGAFVPAGLDPVTVAPGGLERVDLDDVLPAGEPVALRLRSRVPVVASVRSGGAADHAYGGPVAPLSAPAAAVLPDGTDGSVQLTAGRSAAEVTVAAYGDSGRLVTGTTVSLTPGATRAWAPPKSAGYVVATPSRGSVSGAVVYAGPGVAVVPLTALPIRVERPPVRPTVR